MQGGTAETGIYLGRLDEPHGILILRSDDSRALLELDRVVSVCRLTERRDPRERTACLMVSS